jgi:hypothetical protein
VNLLRLACAALLPAGLAAGLGAESADPAPPVSPLLGQVLERFRSKAAAAATGAPAPGLFGQLARRLPADTTAPRSAPAQTQTQAQAQAQAQALTPALGYAMEQLDPASFAVLRPVAVAGSGPLLRTGDVFVLQFSTNLPGRVRLENTDASGRVADLGTYTVLVDQLNRIPRDKGIQLQGQPGTEQLRFYFYPCLPAEAAARPWAAEFQGRLPPCAAMPLAAATSRSLGAVTARALVNLAQPDTTMAFAGAEGYQAGELTLLEARIRHERRSDAP